MAKFNLARWFQALGRAKPTTIHKRKPRQRLVMEELERREMPATLLWDGGGASGVWSDPLNWSDNIHVPQANDDLVFQPGAARLSNTNDIDGLVINSISFSGSNYSIGGTAITLGNSTSGSGFLIANSGSINNLISFDIQLGGAAGDRQFFTVGTLGAALTITGALKGTTGVELSKNGPGTLILSADNSGFTGPISIVEGPLDIRNANALGDTGAPTTVVSTGATSGQLQVENVGGVINETLFINGPGPLNDGALLNVSGNNTWAGNITMDSNATIGSNAGALTINGIISDSGAGHDLSKEGGAKVILDPINAPGTAADATGNTYRGRTFVNAGTLTIRHSYALGDPLNSPSPIYGTNDTVVNSATNRSGTLQLEYVDNPLRIDPNVNASNDGFTVPSELLTLNGPGFDGIHIRPKQPLAGQGAPQAGYTAGSTVTGALNNLTGTNTWAQDISLWNDDSSVLGDAVQWSFGNGGPVLPTVGIGAEAGSTLVITGHVADTNLSPTPTITAGPPPSVTPALTTFQYSLIKVRPGRVVFVHDNYYRGKTEILQGYLNIRDSLGLGAATLNNANNGTFVFPGGTLELEADGIPDSVPASTPPHGLTHLNTDLVLTNENIRPMGDGANNDGAIRNIRGVNEITGNIQLQTQLPRNGVTFNGLGASFGVVADYNMPNTLLFDRSQLTVSGIVGDDPVNSGTSSNLTKFGQGELVLTGDNTYTGRSFITEGWITARNDHALGNVNNNWVLDSNHNRLLIPSFRELPDNKSPETYIQQGAMLVLKQTRTLVPQDINLIERIFVSGDGIDHPGEPGLYAAIGGQDGNTELNHNGAILNLSGNNTISGVVTLVATASASQIGLGADIDSTDPTATQSSLAFSNLMRDDIDFSVTLPTASQAPAYPSIGNQSNVAGRYPYPIVAQPPPAPGTAPAGINKLGRKRVDLQGMGTFTGNNQVSAGVLRMQSDTALGMVSGTTTVQTGVAPEFAGYNTVETKQPTELDQFASTVIAFSSEFTTSPGPWSSSQALGAPNTFSYGDIPTAWSALNPDGPPNPEFLTLGYTTPVYANGVSVRETYQNGYVTQIDLLDINNVFHTVFTGPDPSQPGAPVDFGITFATTPYLVKGVKVTVDPLTGADGFSTWEEIDSVQLSGLTSLVAVTTPVNTFNGGEPGGIQIRENLILNGLGNFTADDPSHDLSSPTRVDTLTNVSDDNQVRGPITFQSDVSIGAGADSRLSLWKPIDGAGGFQKDGNGKLVLGGINSYAGDTFINQGIVNLQSSSALGSPNVSETQTVTISGGVGTTFTLSFNGSAPTAALAFNASALTVQNALNNLSTIGGAVGGSVSVSLTAGVYTITFGGSLAGTNQPALVALGTAVMVDAVATIQDGGGGTTVANNAQIEMQGDITIGGETLTIQGNGPNTAPNIPLRWYAEGPSPINDSFWSGNAVTGRVTGVAVDPNDSNILYLSAAGGGAWRSKNNGFTWQPLIDNINGVTVNQELFTGAIAVSPSNSNYIYVGLGESNNSKDSFYGRGILMSSDFGATWTLIQGPANAFDAHTISKIVVDPMEPDTIYVAVYGTGENEGVGGSGNPGNYGIWRLRGGANGTWVNLIAGSTNPVTALPFDSVNNHYSDLLVFNANPFVTNGNADGRHPNEPTWRIIVFAIGDPFGSLANDVYTQLVPVDDPIATPVTWLQSSIPNAGESVPHPWYSGMIKVGGARGATGANRDVIPLYAALTYPMNSTRFPPVQTTAGTLREVQKGTITWDTNNLVWVLNNFSAISSAGLNFPEGPYVGQGWYDSVIGMRTELVQTPGGRLFLGDDNFTFLAGTGYPQGSGSDGPYVWDGGAWSNENPGTDSKGPHVDYHAYTFDGTGHLIVGNDGGIWRMENTTAPGPNAAQWSNLNQANQNFPSFLQITTLNGVDVHPFDPFFAIGGSQDNGTEIYKDSSIWTNSDGGDGGLVKINTKNPNIIFKVSNDATGGWDVWRSMQAGAPGSWVSIYRTTSGAFYLPLQIDPVNPARILVGDVDGNGNPALLESLDSDQAVPTFHVVGTATSTPNGLSRFGGGFTFNNEIAISDRQGPWQADPDFPLVVDQGAESYDSDTIYALTSKVRFTGNPNIDRPGGVYVTKNHGQAWFRRNGTGGNSLPSASGQYDDYSAITVDPRNRDIAYVVRSVFNDAPGGHVFVTTDAGQDWTDISGNLPDVPTWSVEVNSHNGDVYIGTDNGIWYLKGGQGNSWARFGVGLPNVLVSGIVFNSLTNMVTVSTYGRGMFQLWLDDSKADSGAIRAVTGSSVWTGPVNVTGDVDLRAEVNAQINFVGTIGDSTAGGNHQINKVGPGTVVFSGANTYGGLTDVQEGVLVARNANALGSAAVPTGDTTVEAGAALQLQSDLALETVVLNGDGIAFAGHNTGALRSVSNNNTFTGTIVLNTSSTIGVDSGSQLTIGTKTGLAGTGTIDDGAATRKLTKELTGSLVLNSANTYDGLTDVIQGILRVENGAALGSTINGTQVRNGAQLQVGKDPAGNGITVAGEKLTLSGTGIFGTGALENFAGNNTWAGNVVFTGIQGIAAPPPPVPPSTINIGVLNAADTLTINGTISQLTVTIPAAPPLIPLDVTLSDFGLTKVLPGKLILKGSTNNTYTGLTTVQTGVLNVQKAQALGTTAVGTVVNNGAALETEGNVTYVAEAVTLNGKGVGPANLGALRNTAGANTWTGPVILNSTVAVIPEVQRVTLAGTAGTFMLTFNGSTTAGMPFNAPASQVESELNNLPSILNVGGSVTVTLSGTVYTVTFGGSLAGSDQPQMTGLGAGGATVTIATQTNGSSGASAPIHIGADAGSQLTITGNVQDVAGVPLSFKPAELHKVGAGTIVLPNANTYQGRTFIDTGVINIRNAAALGTSGAASNDTTVVSGGTLQVQNGITVVSEVLTINGLGQNGQGALTNNGGANNWNGTVNLGSNASVGANTTAAGDKLTINGSITDGAGTFSVTKVGPGTVEYANNTNNTYDGLTQVNEGTLLLNKSGGGLPFNGNLTIGDNLPTPIVVDSAIVKIATSDQIPDAAVTTINADGLLDLNGKDETINTLVILDGHAKTGSGSPTANTLTVATTLTMTGGDIELSDSTDQLAFGGSAAINATSSAAETALLRGAGSVALTGAATRTFTVADGPLGVDLKVTAPIAGTAANERLIKAGAGTMEIDSTNTYNGVTEVQAGSLRVDGTIRNVELNGGTLQGIGTTGTVTSTGGGTETPGDSPGILHSGTTTWNSTTNFFVQIDRIPPFPSPLVAGVSYDQLQITGNLDINGGHLTGVVDDIAGSAGIVLHDSFKIITFTGNLVNGGKFAEGDTVFIAGRKFLIHYNAHDITLEKVKAEVTVAITAETSSSGFAANPSIWGQPVTFTIAVNPESPLTLADIPASDTVEITLKGTSGLANENFGPVSTTLVNGQFVLDPIALFGYTLEVGTHIITVKFHDPTNNFNDFNDNAVTTSLTQTVIKASTTIDLSSSSQTAVYGAPVTITAALGIIPPGATLNGTSIIGGTVTFTLDNVVQAPSNVFFNGTQFVGTLALPGAPNFLSVSDHIISAAFSGDGHFNGVATASDLVQHIVQANSAVTIAGFINGNPVNVSAPGQLVDFVVTVNSVSPSLGIPTGTVIIKDGSNVFGSGQIDSNGQITFHISTLSFGLHTLNVDYSGDTNFKSSSGSVAHNVKGGATTTVTSTANPSTFGQNVVFTVHVVAVAPASGFPTGTVDLFDNGNSIAAGLTLSNGTATFQISTLTAGSHPITATYNGDDSFNSSTGPLTPSANQVVNKANTSTTLGALPVGGTVFGQQITFTATVSITAPGGGTLSGTVDFLDNGSAIPGGAGIALSGNTATFQTATLSGGTHGNITARYNGTSDYNSSTSTAISRTVTKASTTTLLASTQSPAQYGQATITATVTPVAPGSGTADNTVTFTITNVQNNTTTAVTINVDNTGVATLPALNVGFYNITAAYNGSVNFNPSSSNTISQIVTKAGTTTNVNSNSNPAIYGSTPISATVSAVSPGQGIPTGTVTFHVTGGPSAGNYDVVVNGSGVATLTNFLGVGSYTITADYLGDGNFDLSNGALSGSQTIIPATSTTAVSSDHNPSVFGQAVTFTATITATQPSLGIPAGNVDFVIDGSTAASGVTLVNGVATFQVSNLSVAGSPHTVLVNYNAATGNFSGSSGNLNGGQIVNKADTTTSLSASINPALIGTNITFTATVNVTAPAGGPPIGSVTFTDTTTNTVLGSNVALSGNQAQLTVSLSTLGNHDIVAHYNGTNNLNSSDSTAVHEAIKGNTTTTLTTSKATTIFGQPTTFTAKVAAVGPASGTPTGSVTFVDITTNTTLGTVNLSGGQAALPVNSLAVGGHTVKATYNPDSAANFFTSNDTTSQTVSQGTTTTTLNEDSASTMFGVSVQFTATVTPNAPSTLTPTGSVQFVVDGSPVVGGPVTLINGAASYTTGDLPLGSHTIVATYTDAAANYAASSDSVSHGVTTATTSVGIVSSQNPSVFQQNVTFTATVSATGSSATTTGSVQFFVDGSPLGGPVTLAGGQAQVTTNAIPVGASHVVTASYTSDSVNFGNSSGTMAQNQVVKISPIVFAFVPGSVKSGIAFTAVVRYMNAAGTAVDTSFNGPITMALGNNPVGGTLYGTLTVNAVAGVATFSTLKITKAANGYRLQATAGNLPAVQSGNINVTALTLAVGHAPATILVNQFFTIAANAVDVTGGVATNYNGLFRLAIVTRPVGAIVTGPLIGNFVNGHGKLANLRFSKAGIYTLRLIGPNGFIKTFLISIRGRRAS